MNYRKKSHYVESKIDSFQAEIKKLFILSLEDLYQWTFFFGKLTKYIRINENIENAKELISIDNEEFISIFTKKWRIL